MSAALDRPRGSRQVPAPDGSTLERPAAHERVEFSTWIRGREVRCWWQGGELAGDPELMARLGRADLHDGWCADAASVASALSAVVAAPVDIRLVPDVSGGPGPRDAPER